MKNVFLSGYKIFSDCESARTSEIAESLNEAPGLGRARPVMRKRRRDLSSRSVNRQNIRARRGTHDGPRTRPGPGSGLGYSPGSRRRHRGENGINSPVKTVTINRKQWTWTQSIVGKD